MTVTAFQQDTFTKVWNHFIVEGGQPSYVQPHHANSGFPKCLYRGPEGAVCAAGLLIPNERWREEWEGKGVEEIPGDVFGLRLDLPHEDPDMSFLRRLQSCHDHAVQELVSTLHIRFHETFRDVMTELANHRGIKIPEEEEVEDLCPIP